MNEFDFASAGIQSWFNKGMVVAFEVGEGSLNSKIRRVPLSSRATNLTRTVSKFTLMSCVVVVSSLSLLNYVPAHASVRDSCSLINSVFSFPVNRAAIAKSNLLDSVEKLADQSASSGEVEGVLPSKQSITAASQIAKVLPELFNEMTAGLDGDGHVFFKLVKDEKFAYLTVEPSSLHLLVMNPGHENVYLDSVKFRPKVLPPKIVASLKQNFAG